MKYVLIVFLIALAALANGKFNSTGNTTRLEWEYLRKSAEVFKNSLNRLGTSFKIVKIKSVTSYIFTGSMDVVNADFQNQYDNVTNCDIKILSHPWLRNGTRFTFNCSDEYKNVTTVQKQQHNL